MNYKILFVPIKVSDRVAFKIGDILKFVADGTIVYGIYLNHYYRNSELGDGMSEGYIVYSVLAFDSGTPNEFYDWEFCNNLTDDKNE